MDQNTDDWLEWRRSGIGASDAPIIMGESKYMTAHELYLDKIGTPVIKKQNDFIINLGHRFEPRARAHLNLMYDWEYEPQVVEMAEYPWLRASLDGWNGSSVMEIKYVGKKKYEDFMNGEFDQSHWIQMQHQMMVTGAISCVYVCYTLEDFKSIDEIGCQFISYNKEYVLDTLWPELFKFWEKVKNKEWG